MIAKKVVLLLIVLLAVFLVSCSKSGQSITSGGMLNLEDALEESQATCIDPDGEDTTRKGTTTGTYSDGTPFEVTDGCKMGLLLEYYCENGNLENKNIRCPGRCNSGTCISDI